MVGEEEPVTDPPLVVIGRPTPGIVLAGTGALFGVASLLLLGATHLVIPALAVRTGVEPLLLWFAVGGLGVFAPLIVLGLFMLQREGGFSRPGWWRGRLRFRSMTRSDWSWSLGALVIIAFLSWLTMTAMKWLEVGADLHPGFMTVEPLTPDRWWILAAWLPFWLLNILGEEFLWRGVVLPRQEAALGRWAWLANASGWFVFHLAFGVSILVTLLPILFILPYVVQRTRNSWTGVVIHAGLNGPAFVAVAMGWIGSG